MCIKPTASARSAPWDRSRLRSRFSALALCGALGCSSGGSDDVVAQVAGKAVHASVVQMVAERDGLSSQQARRRVDDTLRLAAAAQAETTGAKLSDTRQAHLRRAAAARLWLKEDFEPRHRVQDIQASDPAFKQAMASQRNVHPKLHAVCQLVVAPTAGEDEGVDIVLERAKDPAWRARARPMFDAATERLQRYVKPGDPDACALMVRLLRFETQERDGVSLRIEQGGFDLDACAKEADDGSCAQPQWVPEWTEQVRKGEAAQFLPGFETRFGYHLVYVRDILPNRPADDPETAQAVREAIHPAWQRDSFARYIDAARERKAVRMAGSKSGEQ